MKLSLMTFALFLPLAAVACAASPAGDAESGSADADLTASNVSKLTVSRSAGFMPPPPPGACLPHGRYTVDFEAKTLDGVGCNGGTSLTVKRALTDEELTSVRKQLRLVRTAPTPEACPTDFPVSSLSVTRAGRETRYIDELAACSGGAKAVTGESLSALRLVVEKLATAGGAAPRTFEGDLLSAMAIGGESTGRVLRTEDGSFELSFSGGALADEFIDGQRARITGIRADRPGVEVPMRHFIEVTDMLVCPKQSSLNCMPPTDAKACVPANRAWVQSNCDVSFLD